MALTKITPQMFDTSAAGHDFNIDNGTFVVDASANRVGIGTDTPSSLLHVDGALTATTIAGTLTTAAQTNITSVGTLTGLNSSGSVVATQGGNLAELSYLGALELVRSASNAFIDFKTTTSEDYDCRIQQASNGFNFATGGQGSTSLALTLDSSQNATFAGDVTVSTSGSTALTLSGNFPRLYFVDTAGSDLDAYIVNNANGLFFGKTNSPTASNDIMMLDLTNQRVGIGTASPSRQLTVSNSGAALLLLESTGDDNGQLLFGDSSSDTVGKVLYRHSNNTMSFQTAGTERVHINSSGSVGIGVTPRTDTHSSWGQLFIGEKGSLISERLGNSGLYGTLLSDNLYIDTDTGSFANITTDESSLYSQEAGAHRWYSQGSGTAGAAVTLSEKMRIDASGVVGIAEGGVRYASRFSVGKPLGATPGSVFTSSPSSFFSEATLGGTTGNSQKIVTFAGADTTNVSGLSIYRYRRATGTNYTTDGFSLRQEVDNSASVYDYINFAGGKIGIGSTNPQGDLHLQHGSTNTFTASNDSWHTIVLHNNAAAATNTTGIAFEVSGSGYHGNAGTGIAAVKNGTNSDYGADLAFITRPQAAVAVERMRITDSGNVGIGTQNLTEVFEVYGSINAKYQSNNFATGAQRAFIDIINSSKVVRIGSLSGAATPTGNQGTVDITVNNSTRARFDVNGNLAVGSHGNTPTLTHKTNTAITASQSTGNSWTATSGEAGTYTNRGAIEVAGIYNKHFYKWAFTGNLSAQTWYPFAKRSELTTAVNQTGNGSEDGFAMYFRIYTYLSSVGVGEYGSNRLSNMIWINNFGSNSNQIHYFNMGPGFGHAPNTGDSSYGNAGQFRLRVQHRYGSDSTFPADQTFEFYSASALTGLNPGVAGRQILIYGYLL